jgi:hypothetical protein
VPTKSKDLARESLVFGASYRQPLSLSVRRSKKVSRLLEHQQLVQCACKNMPEHDKSLSSHLAADHAKSPPAPVGGGIEPWMLDPIKRELRVLKIKSRNKALQIIGYAAVILVIHIGLAALGVLALHQVFRSMLFWIGLGGLGIGVWQLHRAQSLSENDLRAENEEAAFQESVKSVQLTYTKVVLGCLILVAAVQMMTGEAESIRAAGLVKPAVWGGEV